MGPAAGLGSLSGQHVRPWVQTIETEPNFSSYRYDAGGFFTCYGSGYHDPYEICGEVFDFGFAGLDGALVNASQPFTLTLYTVPEPSTWAMMLSGFALLGLGLCAQRCGVRFARS